MTILVISFFASARTEFSTSSFYAKGVNTKLLSENVINLVEAQLREGVRSTDVVSSTPVAWASQPGMIRSYDNTGAPYKYFKLYSWDNMVGSGAFDPTLAAEVPPTGWSGAPNLYTDLNEPVNNLYAVIDPSAKGSVEGFSYSAGPDVTASSSNQLPMPVKWLYVLKNGSVTIASSTGSGSAVSIPGATANNPIIGRVAFWTDDETSKVNINTASEGIFWDRPVGAGLAEQGNASSTPAIAPFGYGSSIPATAEFQRTAGHPATTSLSAVFGYGNNPVLPDTSFDPSDINALSVPLTTTEYTSNFGPYFCLTPRLQAGGSMGGSQISPQLFNDPGYRLYDSIDELALDPNRISITAGNSALYPASGGANPSGRSALSKLTTAVIEQRRFFISAHSRAPEETLFGTPRISLWPLQDATQTPVGRNAKDNLLAFCSSINNQPYYFQRATWYQYENGYATNGSDVTSYANPSSQSATMDFPAAPTTAPQTGVARNENIYAYLQALTSSSIPGFGGNFLSKYPGGLNGNGDFTSDRDEILTEMFDLIRSGVNTYDVGETGSLLPHYTYTLYKADASFNEYGQPVGAGSTVPIAINTGPGLNPNTHGLGRTYNIAEIALVFMPSAIDLNDGAHNTLTPAGTLATAIPGQPQRMSIGYGPLDPTTHLPIYGLPWAVEVDYPNPPGSTPKFLYWDRAVNPPVYSTYQTTAGGLVDSVTLKPLPATAVTIGDPQTKAVQAFVLVRFFNPLDGPPASAPHVRIRIAGLDQLELKFGTGSYSPMFFNSKNNAVLIHNSIQNAMTTTSGGLTDFLRGNNPDGLVANAYGANDGTTESNLAYPFVSSSMALPTPAYPSPYGGEDTFPPYTAQAGGETVTPPTPMQIHKLTSSTATDGYAGNLMSLSGATLTVDVLDGVTSPISKAATIQSLQIVIPQMNNLPVPTMEMATNASAETCGYGWVAPSYGAAGNAIGGPRIPGFGGDAQGAPPGTPMPLTLSGVGYGGSDYGPSPAGYVPTTRNSWTYHITPLEYYSQEPYDITNIAARLSSGGDGGRMILAGDTVRSLEVNPVGRVAGDMRLLAANPIQIGASWPGDNTHNLFVPLGSARSNTFYNSFPTQGPWDDNPFIRQLHSLFNDVGNGRTGLGLVQTSQAILSSPPVLGYPQMGPISILVNRTGAGGGMGETYGALFPNEHYQASCAPVVTPELNGAFMDSTAITPQIPGDWTTGVGDDGDGPFIDKPDEGAEAAQDGSGYSSYYQTDMIDLALERTAVSFSPNRQVPSGIIFGGLPSRAIQGVPWCTLLFCPNPAANDNGSTSSLIHYGFGTPAAGGLLATTNDPNYFSPPYVTPPDHLFLDLFWMPVVDPYAVSEPFSTAGKVNLNYEIVPFGSYIHRSTALHAVMKSTRILAVPTVANDADGSGYPGYVAPTSTSPASGGYPSLKAISFRSNPNMPNAYTYRYAINLPKTIDDYVTTSYTPGATNANAFYNRFIVQKDLFRSASEICNVSLVPQAVSGAVYYPTPSALSTGLPLDASYANMQAWWTNFKLTGDNGREGPYNQIYPRLTTKSNTFDIHMRVQVLTQTTADRANGTFNTTAGDSVVGEYRGSALVERYLDPNQSSLPDFATAYPGNPTAANTVDNYVRYRVVGIHTFSP